GGIVDEAALYQALKGGRPAAAAFDVFEQEPPSENPLFTLPNFVATPHIAASTAEAQASVAFDVAEEVAAVLAGELPRYAVNAPALPPEELAYLRPFAHLTERLASLHSQLFGGRAGVIELDFEGQLAQHDTNLLVAAAIKGVMQNFTEDRINAVNARLIASARGMKIVERKAAARGSYTSLITVRMHGHELSGTVLTDEPRVVRIDSFRVDLMPEGRFLVSRHADRPGIVGRVGTILGEHDVNIASMMVGRDRRDLLAALRLEPYERRVVLPHERTHRGPKEDRLALMRATRASLEPLWFIYDGAGTELKRLLDEAVERPPDVTFNDPDGL